MYQSFINNTNEFGLDFVEFCTIKGLQQQAEEIGLDPSVVIAKATGKPVILASSKPVSVGLGDTVAKVTHATGLDKLAELYTRFTGKPCGCNSRQEALNKLFPYGVTEGE